MAQHTKLPSQNPPTVSCSLMTGLHSGHCTIRGNDGSYSPLLSNDTTVAKVLKERYNTARALCAQWAGRPCAASAPAPRSRHLCLSRQCLASGALAILAPRATRSARALILLSARIHRWPATTGARCRPPWR